MTFDRRSFLRRAGLGAAGAGALAAGLTPETPIIVATGTLLAGWLLFVLLFRPVKATLVT